MLAHPAGDDRAVSALDALDVGAGDPGALAAPAGLQLVGVREAVGDFSRVHQDGRKAGGGGRPPVGARPRDVGVGVVDLVARAGSSSGYRGCARFRDGVLPVVAGGLRQDGGEDAVELLLAAVEGEDVRLVEVFP